MVGLWCLETDRFATTSVLRKHTIPYNTPRPVKAHGPTQQEMTCWLQVNIAQHNTSALPTQHHRHPPTINTRVPSLRRTGSLPHRLTPNLLAYSPFPPSPSPTGHAALVLHSSPIHADLA